MSCVTALDVLLILNGDAVDGNGRAVCEPGFHPVGVHIEAAGKQFIMVNLISISNGVCLVVLNPAIKPVIDLSIGLCFARLHTFAHFLHT